MTPTEFVIDYALAFAFVMMVGTTMVNYYFWRKLRFTRSVYELARVYAPARKDQRSNGTEE